MEFIESAYPFILTVHITATYLTLAIVVLTDLYGAQWLIGWRETLSPRILSWAHYLVWAGLAIIITAGLLLFLPFMDYLLDQFIFRLKLFFVAMLVINAVVINRHMEIATERSFSSLSGRDKLILVASGLASTTGWIGAFTASQFLPL